MGTSQPPPLPNFNYTMHSGEFYRHFKAHMLILVIVS